MCVCVVCVCSYEWMIGTAACTLKKKLQSETLYFHRKTRQRQRVLCCAKGFFVWEFSHFPPVIEAPPKELKMVPLRNQAKEPFRAVLSESRTVCAMLNQGSPVGCL